MNETDIIIVLSCIVALGLTFTLVYLSRKIKTLREQKKFYKEKYSKELNIRKSSEVRLGLIGENLAPFTKGWPWDPGRFRFLGNPVDGVQFNDDEIIFVEIKTGKARLSKGQKNFKDIIVNKKVRFATFRINEDGSKLTMEEPAYIIDK